MDSGGTKEANSFLLLSGREFASGAAEWNGGKLAIKHFVHIAGKELEDAQMDLQAHLGKGLVAAQATMPVSFCDVGGTSTPDELLAKLARASALAPDNLRVLLFERDSLTPLAPGADLNRACAVGISHLLLDKRKAELARLGVPAAVLSCRILNALGALHEALIKGTATGPVLCASILPSSTQLFIVHKDRIEDIGSVEQGYSGILMQIMSALNLKFEGSAARLFFGNIYDFDTLAESLCAPLAAKIRTKIDTIAGERPVSLMISGMPPARTRMFARRMSASLKLEPLALPILVEAGESGLPEMPAIGAPSLVHMFCCASGINTSQTLFYDLGKSSPALADYWGAPRAKYVHVYRGVTLDDGGRAVAKAKEEKPLPKAAPAPKETPAETRKIIGMYRGSPIYEEATAAVPAEKKESSAPVAGKPAPARTRKIVGMYRGSPVYEDE